MQIDNVLKHDVKDAVQMVVNEELLAVFKDFLEFDGPFGTPRSGMFNYQYTQMDETDLAMHDFRQAESPGRTLRDFVDEAPDVYEEMKKRLGGPTSQLKRLSQEQQEEKERQEALSKLYQEASENVIEPPTLEDYFTRQAKGQSVYEPVDPEEQERRELAQEEERIREDAEDELDYRKELLARMFGGSLTARQYGVLTGHASDEAAFANMQKLQDFKDKVRAKDDIRVMEEMVEEFRRKQVKTGEWTEEESYFKLNEHLQEMHHKYPTERKVEIEKQHQMEQHAAYLKLRNSDTLPTREYYFDEGLGESLAEHVDSLKKRFEGITVSTRRDNDGFAIVTLKME